MCLIEKVTQIPINSLVRMQNYVADRARILQTHEIVKSGSGAMVARTQEVAEVKLISTLRNLNPTQFVPEVQYVLNHLGFQFPVGDIAEMISLYMSNSIACTKAMKSWGVNRSKYFRVCYVISRKLLSYNNGLAEAAFRTRIPNWVKCNEKLVDSLFENLKNSQDYVAIKYLEMINNKMNFNVDHRKKKNKVPINMLPNVDVWVSKYKLTYKSAVDWFKRGPGTIKRKVLLELAARVVVNVITDDDVLMVQNNYPQLIENIYDVSQEEVRKEVEIKAQHDHHVKLYHENKIKATKLREARQNKKFEETIRRREALDMKSASLVYRYLKMEEPKDDLEESVFAVFASYPCQERYFLTGVAWEQFYLAQGKLEETLATMMRRKRNVLASRGVFDYRVDLSFQDYDRTLLHCYKGFNLESRLPGWSHSRHWFDAKSNSYKPYPSKYLARVLIDTVKKGDYVNILQFYKNNAISTNEFINISLLQRLSRKVAKRNNAVLFNKRQFKMDMINDLNQQMPDLITAAHAKVRFKKVTEEVFDNYLSHIGYLGNSQFYEEGYHEFRKNSELRAKRLDIESNLGRKTFLKKVVLFNSELPLLARAVEALNDLERYRMPAEDFTDRAYVIRDVLLELDATIPMMPDKYSGFFHPRLRFIMNNSPVYCMFINRLIKYMIKFLTAFKIKRGYESDFLRVHSKPIREIEEIILLRHRRTWDLIETKQIYMRNMTPPNRGGNLKNDLNKFLEQAQKDMKGQDINKLIKEGLKDFLNYQNNKSASAARERDFYGMRKPKTDDFKFSVAKLFGVEKYLYSPFEPVNLIPLKRSPIVKKDEGKPRAFAMNSSGFLAINIREIFSAMNMQLPECDPKLIKEELIKKLSESSGSEFD